MFTNLRTALDRRRQSVLEAEHVAYTQNWTAFHESLQIAYDKCAPAAERDHHWRVARLAIRKRREIELAADSACRRETLNRWRDRPGSLIP